MGCVNKLYEEIIQLDQKSSALDIEYRSLISNEKQRKFETKENRWKKHVYARLNLLKNVFTPLLFLFINLNLLQYPSYS